jgi:hypothetical protein
VSGYLLRVRDAGLIERAEIDPYWSLEAVVRFNDVDTWLLKLPLAAQGAGELLQDGAGLVLHRDDSTASVVLSGPVTHREQVDDESGSTLAVAGVGDLTWLTRRVAHPQPASAAPPYNVSAYDVRTGVCSTILRQYVDVNAGPGALGVRAVTGLTLAADPGIGTTITGRGRWQVLLTMLQELAIAGGDLGFRVRQSGAGIVFSVYQPVDRSTTVILGLELGNLRQAQWSEDAPTGNYIFAGGGGDGTARTIREGQDSASIAEWQRVERFRDRRDTTDAGELDQSITEELDQNAGKVGLSLTPIDIPQLTFGVDYDLGDRVTVNMRGQTVSEIVREVSIKLTAEEGSVIVPTIGTPGRPVLLSLIDRLRRSERRLTNLERN